MKKLTIDIIRDSILALICGVLFIGIVLGGIIYMIVSDMASLYTPLFITITIVAGAICYKQFKSIIREISQL